MEYLAALQWAKKGFVPNEDAKGVEGWNNIYKEFHLKTPKSSV